MMKATLFLLVMLAMPTECRQINGAIGSRVGAGMTAPLFPNIHDDSPSILMMDSGFFDFRKQAASEKPVTKKESTTAKKSDDHNGDLPYHLWFQ